MKTTKALLVMVLTPAIRDWLKANDPQAFKQACDALWAESTGANIDASMLAKVVEARREHCLGRACGVDKVVDACLCKCGACTARYGDDGVWR